MAYEKRDADFEAWLQTQSFSGSVEALRGAFNAGWNARKKATYEGYPQYGDCLHASDDMADPKNWDTPPPKPKPAVVVDVAGAMDKITPELIEMMAPVLMNPMIKALEAEVDRLNAALAAAQS